MQRENKNPLGNRGDYALNLYEKDLIHLSIL